MRTAVKIEERKLEAQRKGPGRPRAPQTDAAIRQAVWSTLADVGYEALTFEAVAQAAACSRPTLYRRFRTKFELVESIVNETLHSLEPATLDGSARQNLIAHATACAALMSGERGRAIMSIGEAGGREPELAALMKRREQRAKDYVYPEFKRLKREGLSLETMSFAFDTLFGCVIHHVTTRHRKLTAHEIEMLVDSTISILRAHDS